MGRNYREGSPGRASMSMRSFTYTISSGGGYGGSHASYTEYDNSRPFGRNGYKRRHKDTENTY